MNPCDKGERHQLPLTSAGSSGSFPQLKASHTEQNSFGEKPIRIKRRRTRRERNDVKFGRNSTDSVLEQWPSYRGLQKVLPPFWRSQLTNCAKPAPFKGLGGAKPVIITENRLSQHLGMFNKEVKSVNIERLLNPGCEQDSVEVTPLQRDSGVDTQVGEESQAGRSGSDQPSIPCEQLESGVNNVCGMNEDSLPIVVPAVSAVVTEHCSIAPVNATVPGSQSSATPAATEMNQQSELQTAEADTCQSNDLAITNEKENIPSLSPARTKSHKTKYLAREMAHALEKRLDLKAIFPHRNLIREMRQSIISSLLEQKQKLPDFSVLARYKKLAGGSKDDTIQADFRTPVGRDQGLRSESKSSGSNRNSSRGVFPKRRRSQDLFFLPSPIPCFARTAESTDGGRLSPGKDLDFLVEPDRFNQQSFGLTAVQPHSHFLTSQLMNSTVERQRPLQEVSLRTARPWEQGLRDSLQEPRRRLETAKVAYRSLQKKTASQRRRMPFATWDSRNLVNVSTNDGRCRQFPVVDSQQYSYINELRSEQWGLQNAEPALAHSLHLLQDQWDSQTLGVGLRSTERAAPETQTSFDVLRSIWSPNVLSSGTRCPMPQALSYPFLAHQPSSSREMNSDHREFLQLYNISPEQNWSHRQNPLQEIHVSSRHPQNGHRVFSGLARPRSHCHKAALEPGRISNAYHFWGPSGTSERIQGTTEKGYPSSRIQACSRETLSQMEGLQQLRLFQQLPMSYFPPSEVLENKQSSHTLQDHLLGQSSPEPWAFPRMKLY